ncbi:autotransporter domain-containing protein [Actinobacillus arthritidis]|uniref:autotransporter domain-containing protein n=1 Tax=Actinobacillus arthritidis TaxID=157339 RepID=UPI0024435B82|nr:autotransporter domain-containing protein [Actinobacillus arthritidis]WGE88858.1 autotransporter domain-containing protein [Actinobacillus arthritidis]
MTFTKNRIALAILFGIPTVSVVMPTVAVAQSRFDVTDQLQFQQALNAAKINQTLTVISLLNDIVISTYNTAANDKRALPLEMGNVTIEGNNRSLTVRAAPISLTGNVVMSNLKLILPPATGEINLDVTAKSQEEVTQFIYQNGKDLTLNNVDTQINQNAKSLATIVMGNGTDTSGEGNGTLTLSGVVGKPHFTKVKEVIAGNTNNKEKTTASTINIEENADVSTITFGKEANPVSGSVVVNSDNNSVDVFQGGSATNTTVNLKKANEATIKDIKNVTVETKKAISANQISNVDTLTLKSGAVVTATAATTPLTINKIVSEGNNEVRISPNNEIQLTEGVTDNNLKVSLTGAGIINKPYVTISDDKPDNVTVADTNNGTFEFKDKAFKLIDTQQTTDITVPVIRFEKDTNNDGVLTTNEEASNTTNITISFNEPDQLYGDETIEVVIIRNGKQETIPVTLEDHDYHNPITIPISRNEKEAVEIFAVTKDPKNVRSPKSSTLTINAKNITPPTPVEQRNGSSVTAETKPAITIEQQNGSSLTAEAKPEIAIVQKNGSGVTTETKPEIAIEQQNGSGVTAEAKPEITVEQQNGSGVTAEAKPAITIIEQQNGSSVTTEAKPAITIEQQNGSSITTEVKPAITIEQQNGSGVTAEAKPAITIIEQQNGSSVTTEAKPAITIEQQNGSSVTTEAKPAITIEQQNGSSVTTEAKPAITIEQQNGSSLTAEAKPAITIEQQNGSGVTAEAKPEITIEQKNGSSVTTEVKPAITIEQQNGSSVTTEAKPAITIEQQNGSSLTAEAKPEITIEQKNGSSLTTEAKPAITIEQQNGSSVTTNTKPEITVEKQNGSSVTAEEKPTTETPVVQTKGTSVTTEEKPTIAIQIEPDNSKTLVLLESQRIANIPLSNLATQTHDIATISADLAQAVIEKFPENGNNYRVWSKNTLANSKHYANFHKGYESDSFRTQLGISGLINERTQVGWILNDMRSDNDFADNAKSENKFLMSSIFMKYQTPTGNFVAIDVGLGRIKNELKTNGEEIDLRRKVWQAGLTFGKELKWKQIEITPKAGIRYSHLESANYQLNGNQIQEEAVGFVSYLVGLDAGYRFNLAEHYSLKPFVSLEHWWNKGNSDVKVNGYNFNFNASNQYHYLGGLEFAYKNFKLKASAGITNGSQMAKQNLARLHLSYDF